MRVAIDARPAVFAEKTGVGYYTWNLLKHLPRVDPSGRYLAWYLNARALLGGPRRNLRELPGVRERWTPIPARWFDRLESYELPRLEWFVRFDVLFAPKRLRQRLMDSDVAPRDYEDPACHTLSITFLTA